MFDRVLNTTLDWVFIYKLRVWHIHTGSPLFNSVDLLVASPPPLFSSAAFLSKSHAGSFNISFSVSMIKKKIMANNWSIFSKSCFCCMFSLSWKTVYETKITSSGWIITFLVAVIKNCFVIKEGKKLIILKDIHDIHILGGTCIKNN